MPAIARHAVTPRHRDDPRAADLGQQLEG